MTRVGNIAVHVVAYTATAAVVGLGATGHYSQAFAVFTVAAAINWLLSQVAA